MNERIKWLAEKAGANIFEEEHARIGEISEVSFNQYSDLEKFVQLVVDELVRDVSDLMDYTEYHHTDVRANEVELKALRRARNAIKQHFAIK